MALNPGLYSATAPEAGDDVPVLPLGGETSDTAPFVWDLTSLWWWDFTAPADGNYTFDTVATTGEGTRYAVAYDLRQIDNGAPPLQTVFTGWEPAVEPGNFYGETSFSVIRMAAGTRVRVAFQAYSTEDGATPSTTVLRVRVRTDGAEPAPVEIGLVGSVASATSPIAMPAGTEPGDIAVITMLTGYGNQALDYSDIDNSFFSGFTTRDQTKLLINAGEYPGAFHAMGVVTTEQPLPDNASIRFAFGSADPNNLVMVTVYRARAGAFPVGVVWSPIYGYRYLSSNGTQVVGVANAVPGAEWTGAPEEDNKIYTGPTDGPADATGIVAVLGSFATVNDGNWSASMALDDDVAVLAEAGGIVHPVALEGSDLRHHRRIGPALPTLHYGMVTHFRLTPEWLFVPGAPISAEPPPVRLYPRDDGRGMSAAPRLWPPSKARRLVGGHR